MLFYYPYPTPTEKIYKDTRLMNIKGLFNYCTCMLVYKIKHKIIRTNINFTTISQTHKRSIRRPSHIVLPKTQTNFVKNTNNSEHNSIKNFHLL